MYDLLYYERCAGLPLPSGVRAAVIHCESKSIPSFKHNFCTLTDFCAQCYSCILSKWINIFNFFSRSVSNTILVFRHQRLWQYSDGEPRNEGVECRWVRQKSRFSTGLIACCPTVRPWTVIHTAAPDALTVASWWHSSLVSGVVCFSRKTDDKVFMTRSLNVTPKTTELNLI